LKKRKGPTYKEILGGLKKRSSENSKAAPYDNPQSLQRFFRGTRRPPRSKLLQILTWGFEITNLREINRVLEIAKYEALSKKEIEDFQLAATVRNKRRALRQTSPIDESRSKNTSGEAAFDEKTSLTIAETEEAVAALHWQPNEHQSGVRASQGKTRTGVSHAVPIDDATGIIQIGDEWHTLRDSAALHTRVGRCGQGGTLYLVCINPQAFMPWRQQIEAGLCSGVKLRLAYVDVERAASAGRAAEWYAASMCSYGEHNASKSTRANLIELSTSIDKARQQTGADPDVEIYRSFFPHPFLCAIYRAPVSSGAHLGWGLVSSYLMFTEAAQSHNFGVLFAEPGTVYDRYFSSVRSYFDFLQKHAVPDRFGNRGSKKPKLRRMQTPGGW
jgi:hypothetical protein